MLWEEIFPRRQVSRASFSRWPSNILLTLTNMLALGWLDAAIAVGVAWWVVEYSEGPLILANLEFLPALVVTSLVYELFSFILHVLFHRVPWLWRIHAVHHSDTELDFTSTYRHHPLENILGTIVVAPLTLVLGPPVLAMIVYQGFRVSVNILSHSNAYLPERVDQWLSKIIVTPDFHRGHHSTDRQYTNSNYGSSLTLFDHLFGTATRQAFDKQATMPVGLNYFRDKRDSRLDQMLWMPFRKWPQDRPAKVEPRPAAN